MNWPTSIFVILCFIIPCFCVAQQPGSAQCCSNDRAGTAEWTVVSEENSDTDSKNSSRTQSEGSAFRRTEWSESFAISAAVKNEVWRVAKGGINADPHFISNADLILTADLFPMAGIERTDILVHLLANNGESLSSSVGDAQMVSNIEAYRTVKLYQLLVRHSIPSIGLSLLAGVYDLNSEFYVTPTSGVFLNGSHGIGVELGLTGLNGPSIFPNTALSMRLQYSPSEKFQFSAAIIDGHPGTYEDCTAFDLSVNRRDGFFTIAEAALLHDVSSKYAVGLWYFTGSYADVCAVDGLEEYTERRDNAGFYILADKKVFSESGSESEGLSFFSRFGMTNHHINEIQFHFGGGFTYTGLFEGRSEDQIGYAVAFASYGSDFQKLNRFISNPVASN